MIYLKTINGVVNAYSYPIENAECQVEESVWRQHCNNNDNKIVNGQFVPNHIDTRSYAEKRKSEYPAVGDMIDALCKAKLGDETELMTLIAQRQEIKLKYPKD